MKMYWRSRVIGSIAVMAIVSGLGSGCAAFRTSTSTVDVREQRHMKADYDYSDMRQITENVVNSILGSPFLVKASEPPILIVAGIENRTSRYVDTKQLTDRMRTMILQSGKAQFVNESRRADLMKEQGFQAANATPETQARIGAQMGASYMLSGSFVEMSQQSGRQVRVSKKKLNYYNLTIEVTDLETGLIVWTTEEEFAREESQPLIGW